MKKKPRHYVNNKTLYEKLIEYKAKQLHCKENKLPPPKTPEYIGECILLICERLSNKLCFINYSYKSEMVADAIENCVRAIDAFNPEKSNAPFAYFTRTAWRAFLRRIDSEKKQNYVKHKLLDQSMIMELAYELQGPDEQADFSIDSEFMQNSWRIISDFEQKQQAKSEKASLNKLKNERIEDDTEEIFEGEDALDTSRSD